MSQQADPEVVLTDGAPADQQIATQLRGLIRKAALHPGEELPTVRAMAVGLAVNPAAVEAAYARLEEEGFVTSADGSGVRVVGCPRAATLDRLCEDFLRQAADRGYSPAEVAAVIRAKTPLGDRT